MRTVLALDISTSAGWAVLTESDGGSVALTARGVVKKEKSALEYAPYPEGYVKAARYLAGRLYALVTQWNPDEVVVEETNTSRSSFSQKLLEWIHLEFLALWGSGPARAGKWPAYLRTGVWRHALGLKKPTEAKKSDELLKKARAAADRGECSLSEAKKRFGVRGKWNRKTLAVDYANERFGLDLKVKDNDVAEAICIGCAFLAGAPACDGDTTKKRGH